MAARVLAPTLSPPSRRQIRRAFGPAAVGTLESHEQAIQVFAEVLTRGLLGRLKWLVFGR